MCDDQNCPVVKNGIYIYTDDDHISASYSLNQHYEFASTMNWLVPKNTVNATGEGK
jgi:hypothetical protein